VKYEAHGRRYAKPLGRNESPVSRRYGYNTRMDTKAGVKGKSSKMAKSRALRNVGVGVVGLGKALPTIGYAMVGANLANHYRKGSDPNTAVEDSFSIPGLVRYDFDKPIMGSRKLAYLTSPNFIAMSLGALYPGGLF